MKSYHKVGTPVWDYETAANDLPWQVGSMTKLIMQLSGKRHNEGLSKEELMRRLSDELADVVCVALYVAHELDIDIEKAFDAMLESDKKLVASRSVRK